MRRRINSLEYVLCPFVLNSELETQLQSSVEYCFRQCWVYALLPTQRGDLHFEG